ncbi:MAG: AAA family ATPase [Caldilineaceae bacterium]
MGGGIVPGAVALVGGDPGIGKSTLLLQMAAEVAETTGSVLYVSAEESAHQIRRRAARLGLDGGERLFIYPEIVVEQVTRRSSRCGRRWSSLTRSRPSTRRRGRARPAR